MLRGCRPATQALPLAVDAMQQGPPLDSARAGAASIPAACDPLGQELTAAQLIEALGVLGQRCVLLADFTCRVALEACRRPSRQGLVPLAFCCQSLLELHTAGCRALWFAHGDTARSLLGLHGRGWRVGVVLALRPIEAAAQLYFAARMATVGRHDGPWLLSIRE